MRPNASALCLLLIGLGACASVPRSGDLSKTERYRTDVRALIEQKIIRADATQVRVQAATLAGWNVIHVPITPELFAEAPSKNKRITFDVYVHDRTVDWECRYSMGVPALINSRRHNNVFDDKDLFKFGAGDCYELVPPEKKFVAYLSLFNLAVDLDAIVPKEKRVALVLDDALLYLEWRHYKGYSTRRTDQHGSDMLNVTVAEVAGYHKDEFDIVPHVPFFDIKRSNYYRIMLMGKHTISLLTVVGPTSSSVGELQAEALPILKALRYEGTTVK
jgi:hypothetical protein